LAVEKFEQHPQVLDGCSDLMADVFGTRSAQEIPVSCDTYALFNPNELAVKFKFAELLTRYSWIFLTPLRKRPVRFYLATALKSLQNHVEVKKSALDQRQ
jgi:hypothetical protein